MASTFENNINEVEVSLAIERLLAAPFPQAWTPARIDLDSLPTGFVDLGAVVEDTPSLVATKTKFNLDVGIPAVRQFEAVVGLEGTFEISLHSNSWRKLQYAFGNVSPISSTTECSTVASVTDRNTITFANTSDVESLPVGAQFTIASSSNQFDKTDAIETRVSSITDDGLTFFLDPTPIRTPAANDVVGYYEYVQQFSGTIELPKYVLLGVADFIDGSQVVHHMFKASPGEEFTQEIRPTENYRIPLSFDLFGVSRTDIPGITGGQLVLYRNVYFPTTG